MSDLFAFEAREESGETSAEFGSGSPDEIPVGAGFRLRELQVCNWGTFDSTDGRIHTAHPQGRSALLIGKNGHGKSTLVDALLALLVRPGIRNFNVASGGKKRERDERTYLQGAYDRNAEGDGDRIRTQFLRPKSTQMSVLLATFANAATGNAFTLAQIMYLKSADEVVEKVYCFADGLKSIQEHLSRLGQPGELLRTLKRRDFRATRVFSEYEGWFSEATGVRGKAGEIFNQTVAVKDIERLNDFVRKHMLESGDWSGRVDTLLKHFAELTDAHAILVRATEQAEKLEPVAKFGKAYQEREAELAKTAGRRDAAEYHFAREAVRLFEPKLVASHERLERLQTATAVLKSRGRELDDEIASLKREIESAGGERLIELNGLIRNQRDAADGKRRQRERLAGHLRSAGVEGPFDSELDFARLTERLRSVAAEVITEREVRENELLDAAQRVDTLASELESAERERRSLLGRRENIPAWAVDVRAGLCDAIGLPAAEFPFAGELIAVDDRSRDWESSIENLLHGFALSLLVPDRRYRIVCEYIERTRLHAEGRGRRLVYLRIDEASRPNSGSAHPSELIHKLKFKPGHALKGWVEAEIRRRFDHRCCETLEEFQQAPGNAITKNRHTRSGRSKHQKDDTERAFDHRNYVLGWDNTAKRERLAEVVSGLRDRRDAAFTARDTARAAIDRLEQRRLAVAQAGEIRTFDEIDFLRHEAKHREYTEEKRQIEENSDVTQELKRRLGKRRQERQKVDEERTQAIRDGRDAENDIKQTERLLTNARAECVRIEQCDNYNEVQGFVSEIADELSSDPLGVDTIHMRREAFMRTFEAETESVRQECDRDREKVLGAMAKFLSSFPMSDLDATVASLPSFLALEERIRHEDLPRHTDRFKVSLNEKVIGDIGLFRGQLDYERHSIASRIEVLNESLKTVDFRPGTFIQIEARETSNAEIVEFRKQLRDCIGDTERDDAESNEFRYDRIRKLVDRLGDENERRWRERVVDVRQWFNFVANVTDRHTLERVSSYDDSTGQSGGEKAKLAFTILVAAIAYQYDLCLDEEHRTGPETDRFRFVMVDEMFSKVDDQHARYALDLFQKFGLQLLIVAPLDAKACVCEPYVGSYLIVQKGDDAHSEVLEITARQFEELGSDPPAGPPR